MSRITPLSADAVAQIHSSKHITSLQGVVLALLENSLDAGASKVEVHVDFRRGDCTVEDNGAGISAAEFEGDGGLGKLYHTSKRAATADTGELHGNTGTYLASLAALSLLTITSRQCDGDQQASLVMHQGKVSARYAPAPVSHELMLSTTSGTRVTVRDLFGNMPVRVKQRILSGDSNAEDEKVWQELKRGVAALLLAWPKPCAVRLHDARSDSRSVTLAGSHPAASAALTKKTLDKLGGKKARFGLHDTLPILFQAGIAPAESRQSWVPVSASTSHVSVKGFICLEPAPTKYCQFICIGIHPCSAASGHNELYEAVNKIFSNSSFGAMNDVPDIDEAEKDRRKRDRRYKNDGYTQKQLQGRKGVDRHPMLILKIKPKDVQNHNVAAEKTSEASLKAMIDVVEATATQWLAAHHFRPLKRRKRKNEQQQGPSIASSSPLRPSTAAPSTLEYGTFATPSLKRSATVTWASTSKKRRIIDVSEKSGSRGLDGHRQSPSTYFSGLSRIKSGTSDFYDRLWEIKKPSLGSTEPSEVVEPAGGTSHPFKLAPLDVCELSSVHRRRNVTAEIAQPFPGAQPAMSRHHQQAVTAMSSDNFGSIDDGALLAAAEMAEKVDNELTQLDSVAIASDAVVEWTDPVTKQMYEVNTRTGIVLPAKPQTRSVSAVGTDADTRPTRRHAAINTSVSSAGRPLSLARRHLHVNDSPAAQWLPGFLKDWSNPVFAKQDEERIPVASIEGPGFDAADTGHHRCTDQNLTQYFTETARKSTSKLSKAGLHDVRVIKQVDEKFILCSMPSMESGDKRCTLVLVDQHAASERVILEGLLRELCTPLSPSSSAATYTTRLRRKSAVGTTLLDQPPRFHISEKENELFSKHAQHFANWGVLYDLTQIPGVVTTSQVREPSCENRLILRALPLGIAERCTLFPNLLIELLRSEVWTVTESGDIRQRQDEHDDEGDHAWLRRIGSCPKGIIDMLNSRACRSAIMFNDVLSTLQCEELLADLSRCAFPFMCAHGRVSMVPLIEMGGEGESSEGIGGDDRDVTGSATTAKGFASAFRDWRDRDDSSNEDPHA